MSLIPLTQRLTLWLCALAFASAAMAAPPRLIAGDVGQKDLAPSPTIESQLGGLVTYTDRVLFEADFPGLPVEDFESGQVADGALEACGSPLDASGDGVCFAPGALLAGFVLADQPGPDDGDLLLVGDGFFGNPTKIVASNPLADGLEIAFPDPVEAVGLDLFNLPGPDDALTIDVFGPSDELLGSVAADSSSTGEFFGVSSSQPIARLLLTSAINEAEGIDDLTFSVGSFLSFESAVSVDTCAPTPINQNGVVEPGEEIELSVTLRASAGAFSNISGTLTSTDAGVVFLVPTAGWPNLASGESGANATPLRFVVSDESLCDLEIDLQLELSTAQGSFEVPVALRVGATQAPDVPQPIPDAELAGAMSELEIATATTVDDLGVVVDIEHTWVGDLIVRLTSPGGTTVTLLDRPGVPGSPDGCDNNNVRVVFRDDAAVDPENFCNPDSSDAWIGGAVLPTQPLAGFDGESTQGTWRLTVIDTLAGDLGTLVDWSLENLQPLGAECVACGSQADVQLVKTCLPAPNLSCVLEATNLGPSAALDVLVTDPIPAPVTWVADDCGAGPPTAGPTPAGTLNWDIGSLDVGAVATCTVLLDAPDAASGDPLNVATVSSSTPDPQPDNDVAEEPIPLATLLEIPTLDVWGTLGLILLLAGAAAFQLRRRVAEEPAPGARRR
ncbi:MAG: proprotein convertase P-domain-containing protein [Acidobacteriota bacterium]